MTGTDRNTGKPLSGRDHLFQSVADILTTRIGTRVERRNYGSRVYEFVDKPLDSSNLVGIYQAVGEALANWEPRLQVTSVKASLAGPDGKLSIDVTGIYLPEGTRVELTGIPVS